MSKFLPENEIEPRLSQRCLTAFFLSGQILLYLLKGKIPSYRPIMEQLVAVGPGSLIPVLLVAFFAGMIFTVQMARELLRYGVISALGGAFALAFCRELAPILTASVVAGQVGAAFAAEIGQMEVTEQIDALYMLRCNPLDYLVIPRLLACCLMMPVLTVLGLVVGIFGGLLVADGFYQIDSTIFLDSIREFLGLPDLLGIILKALIFGTLVAIIGCTWGLTTKGGAKGVSKSAKTAVIVSWVSIFIADFLLTLLIFHGINLSLS